MSPIRPSVAAVIIARNEADHVRQCLEPLQWCDERIWVDMMSEDRSRELAAPLVTKMLEHPMVPHMEFARNPGIEAATSDWILVVDADEVIPPPLVERLRAFAADPRGAVGLWLPRMNYCFGRPVPHVGGFPDYQLRFFRRGAGLYPDRLHSQVQLTGRAEFLPIEDGVWMLHLRRNAAITDLVMKWDTYAGREADKAVAGGATAPGPATMLWAALSSFRARFFTMHGYRDGMPGLILSVLFAFYRFEVEAKTWEAAGAGTERDRDVGRLRSTGRLLAALAAEGARRLSRRVVPRRGDDGGPRAAA